MKTTLTLLAHRVDDESGVTAIEYALLASLIAVVIAIAVGATGTALNGLFTTVANAVAAAA